MFRFLHAADIHLDSPLVGLKRYGDAPAEEIRGATRRAFENLVRLAIAEEVAFVLLAGDLYDGDWKDYNTGLFFARQMGRLNEAGIPVFAVAGNHDAASEITKALRPPENVRFFSTRGPQTAILDEIGCAIHGRGFPTRGVSEDLSQGLPPGDRDLFNIGLLHTSLDGRPGHAPYAPCSPGDLKAKGYQYWALGHVHLREVVCRDPWIVFPGNTQGRNCREAGPKGCTIVTVEDREVVSCEHRDLDVLRWSRRRVDLAGVATAGEALDRARKALEEETELASGRPLAVRLHLVGKCRAHRELKGALDHWVQEFRALASGLGGEGVWIEKVLVSTEGESDLAGGPLRDDALGGLLRGIRDLEAEETGLLRFACEFSDLKRRLPAEVLDGEEAIDPTDAATLRGLMEGVKDLLLTRLLSTPYGR